MACQLAATSVRGWVAHPLIGVGDPLAKKPTLPPPSDDDTLAVNVTDWPYVEESAEDETVVVVGVADTVTANGPTVVGPTESVAVTEYVKDVVPGGGVPVTVPSAGSMVSQEGAPEARE